MTVDLFCAGSNAQNLRAAIAWLGVSQREASTELGCSVTLLRGIMSGTSLPDQSIAERIALLSARWPYGVISVEAWPSLTNYERRGRK